MEEEQKDTEKVLSDIIRIDYFTSDSKIAKHMMEYLKHSADIAFRYKDTAKSRLTNIRIVSNIDGVEENEKLAHEFGHFLQMKIERETRVQFLHQEDLSWLLEDTVRDFLRRRMYSLDKVR